MVKRIYFTVAIVIAAVFLGIFLSYQYGRAQSEASAPETVAKPSASGTDPSGRSEEELGIPQYIDESAQEDPPSSGYIIRDYDGKVAIFSVGSSVPEMVFDVYTRTLPEEDRERLASGVYVATYEELTALVEDYIS